MSKKPVIVTIDDDIDIQTILKATLSGNCTVIDFDQPDTALLALTLGLRADLLIMDIHFAGGANGIGFVNKLKKHPALAKTRVLFLSGDVNLRDICEATGAAGYLEKPCSSEDIRAAVETILKSG